jgi:hypothetical protein
LFSVKEPSAPVVTVTRGQPDGVSPQMSQLTPVVKDATGQLGT